METTLDIAARDRRVAQLTTLAAAIAAQREALDRLESMRDELVRLIDRESDYSRTTVAGWAGVTRARVWQIINPSGYVLEDGHVVVDDAVVETLEALYDLAVTEWENAGGVGSVEDYFHADARVRYGN
jgi:hypothetical protein